jgi:hypothetical protein
MRQVGVLCAAAYVAVRDTVGKLADDHRKAKALAGFIYSYFFFSSPTSLHFVIHISQALNSPALTHTQHTKNNFYCWYPGFSSYLIHTRKTKHCSFHGTSRKETKSLC